MSAGGAVGCHCNVLLCMACVREELLVVMVTCCSMVCLREEQLVVIVTCCCAWRVCAGGAAGCHGNMLL